MEMSVKEWIVHIACRRYRDSSLGRNRAKLLKQVRPVLLLNDQPRVSMSRVLGSYVAFHSKSKKHICSMAFTDKGHISLWVKLLERNDTTYSINELITIFDCKINIVIIQVCRYWELLFYRIKTGQLCH